MAAPDRPAPLPSNAGTNWTFRAALAVNWLLGRVASPFLLLDTVPADPSEGDTYYDTALHKARTFDGSVWRDHW